jgi:hypothetical protein
MKRRRYEEPCTRTGCSCAADSRCTFQAFGVNVYHCVLHAPQFTRRKLIAVPASTQRQRSQHRFQ